MTPFNTIHVQWIVVNAHQQDNGTFSSIICIYIYYEWDILQTSESCVYDYNN